MRRAGFTASLSTVFVLALLVTCDAYGQEASAPLSGAPAPATRPHYELVVVTDDASVVSYELLAPRLATELDATIGPPSESGPTPRARIEITYAATSRELSVRVAPRAGQTLERKVQSANSADELRREATLLAGNLARDEASELLGALSERKAAKAPAPAPPKNPEPPPVDEGFFPVNGSFVYPLASNWGKPHLYTYVDLALVYGHVGTVHAAISPGMTHASRAVVGGQIGAAVALSERRTVGVQITGGGALSLGTHEGVQAAGGFNYAGERMTGAQLSGGVNITAGAMTGVQGTAGLNYAREIAGVQGTAGLNLARDVSGVQAGVVNIAWGKVQGAQIGVINYADDIDGAPVGIVSIIKQKVHPIAWGGNLAYANAGVKFAARRVYSLIALTAGSHESGFDAIGGTVGLGAPVPIVGALDVAFEGALSTLLVTDSFKDYQGVNVAAHGRILPGYSLTPRIRVFAGGGVRTPLTYQEGREVVRPEVLAGFQL